MRLEPNFSSETPEFVVSFDPHWRGTPKKGRKENDKTMFFLFPAF